MAWADPGVEASPLRVNAEYVLYADRRTAAQVPGVADLAPMFSPLSGDAGVLDVRGTSVASHGGAIPEFAVDGRLGWTLESVKSIVSG